MPNRPIAKLFCGWRSQTDRGKPHERADRPIRERLLLNLPAIVIDSGKERITVLPVKNYSHKRKAKGTK